jgi:hypothetical protein
VDGEAADVHPEDRLGVLLGLGAVLGELDAARLAAAADQDLGLDHDRITEVVSGLDGLRDRGCGPPLGHGNTVLLEELLALILEKVHEKSRMSGPRVSGQARSRRAPYRNRPQYRLGAPCRYPSKFAS